MKTLPAFLMCAMSACAAELEWPRLAGIVLVTNKPRAVLMMPRSPNSWFDAWYHLGTGEAVNGFEVMSVDVASGTVRLRHSKSPQTTDLKFAQLEKGQNYAVHFERAPLASVIDTYQVLSGRTVIRSPQLVPADIDVHIPAQVEDVPTALAKALEAHDTWIIPYADKYAFALPGRHKALAESIPPLPRTAAGGEIIPPGLIKFTEGDTSQVLEFYGQLSGRTVLYNANLPGPKITLTTQTLMTREEAGWLIEAALRVGALITVPAGDKLVFVVPPNKVNGLPVFDSARQLPGNSGTLKLEYVDPRKFLDTYATLTGRKALPIDANFLQTKFTLRTTTPLSPAEAAFALEGIAMLNNFAFQPVGDNEVKLVRRASLAVDKQKP